MVLEVESLTEEISACPICEQDTTFDDPQASKILGLSHTSYGVRKCNHCDLRWLSPRPTANDYAEMYKSEDYFSGAGLRDTYEQERDIYYKKKCQAIQGFMGNNSFRLLDVGTGTGEFVAIARNFGIDAEGMDISEGSCMIAKDKYNIDLECTDIHNSSFNDASFDVVQIHHVLEHVLQPIDFLAKASNLLKQKGLLVIEVPYQFDNTLEIFKKVLGRTFYREFSYSTLHHAFFYSPKSLSILLEKAGFNILTTKTYDQNNPASELKSNSAAKELIKTIILSIGGIFNKGDFIEVYARKS